MPALRNQSQYIPSVEANLATSLIAPAEGHTFAELQDLLAAAYPGDSELEQKWPFAYAIGTAAVAGLLLWSGLILGIVKFL